MQQKVKKLYSARPINTYEKSADVGDAYLAFLSIRFPGYTIVDPNAPAIVAHAKELKAACSIDPATGAYSEDYYNKVGSARVMAYFTDDVVGPCEIGIGLSIPVRENGRVVYKLPAGVAGELFKFHQLSRPGGIAIVEKHPDGSLEFSVNRIVSVSKDEQRSSEKETLYLFVTEDGLTHFQLSVAETRARIYRKRLDGSWDRTDLQPYFLEDTSSAS